jgi:CheY-like chemotaxis protein
MEKYKTALLIDDDYITNALNSLIIKDMKIAENTLAISSSTKAIDYLATEAKEESNKPLLILLDINMPAYNGFEVLEKAITKGFDLDQTCIMFLTSSNDQRDIKKAIDFNIKGYLLKPLEPNILLKAITEREAEINKYD